MSKHYTAITAIAIVMAGLLTLVTVNMLISPKQEGQNAHENLSGISMQEEEYEYLLKEYQERIGVFRKGADTPEMMLNVYVYHLPKYDQQMLKEGIPAKDYQQLVSLMEDYTS